MGAALGSGFTTLANELAVAGLGIATLALVVLGLGLMFSIFDRYAMVWLKDALLRVIGGSAPPVPLAPTHVTRQVTVTRTMKKRSFAFGPVCGCPALDCV